MATFVTSPAGADVLTNPPVPKPKCTRTIDLTQIPTVGFAWVDEHVFAAIRGCSVKVLQRERQQGIGCGYRKINGTSIRYKIADIHQFLESQPAGGGSVGVKRGPGRPRRTV